MNLSVYNSTTHSSLKIQLHDHRPKGNHPTHNSSITTPDSDKYLKIYHRDDKIRQPQSILIRPAPKKKQPTEILQKFQRVLPIKNKLLKSKTKEAKHSKFARISANTENTNPTPPSPKIDQATQNFPFVNRPISRRLNKHNYLNQKGAVISWVALKAEFETTQTVQRKFSVYNLSSPSFQEFWLNH